MAPPLFCRVKAACGSCLFSPQSILCPVPGVKLLTFHSPSFSTDVPSWLKSLRLHKYAALFSQMSYEEMMTLTEQHLESQVMPTGPSRRCWGQHHLTLSLEPNPWLLSLLLGHPQVPRSPISSFLSLVLITECHQRGPPQDSSEYPEAA